MTARLAGRAVAGALAALASLVVPAAAQPRSPVVVDAFETADGWSARPSDGVELKVTSEPGLVGNALRLDFRFVKGGGYAVVHKDLALDLPENYRFRFAIRGECLPNNLEFKLIDSTGANVWWANRRDFRFPARWDSVTLKQRHIGFAWGPAGGGDLRRAAALEFAVTAGGGGTGTVWIDELTLQEQPRTGAAYPAIVASSSGAPAGHEAARAVDGDPQTAWRGLATDPRPWMLLDFQMDREFGGLVLDWEPDRYAADYLVEGSTDGVAWRALREVRGGNGGRDYLGLPESEARFVRLHVRRAAGVGAGLREIAVQPLEWAASPEKFYEAVARDAPRGSYPRGITGEQQFWTITGLDGGREEALFSEDGALESGKAAFSVEPFLYARGKLITWADVRAEQWLEDGHLPIPTVKWTRGALTMAVTAFAAGDTAAPRVYARYRVTNGGPRRTRATLYLALRPFQVNPPVQFLNTPGGTAPLRSLAAAGAVVRANGERGVVCLTAPAAFGAAAFDQGDITEYLRSGRLPAPRSVTDPLERASGALAYPLDLAPGATAEVDLLIPLREAPTAPPAGMDAKAARAHVEAELAACRAAWRARTERVAITLPDSLGAEVVRTLKAQLAYILVNRDGPGIQPGSRSYERSWIRDGALTSSALLRLGQADVVRDFAEWFAGYQYADGKVPCCVDARGSDPVPEHDSSGEFIYLVAEYYRYTGDRGLAERLWPAVAKAAAYLDSLRQLRRTDEYRAPDRIQFFGLLPPSISHEGYSAKPMHSYWDDFFALRGFKDAAYLAGVLGRADASARWAAARAEFQGELAASLRAAMAAHKIDYLPGCADLGDFDATSTTIALDPVQADDFLPKAALTRTFEKYWENFTARRDGAQAWEAYTPYEMRTIGAFVQLGWGERAQELLRYFLAYRRPPGWKQWAEVVWRDEVKPHFIGDLPHTWVGSDYVRSVLDLLAYARERDSSLVLGAGVPLAWVEGGEGLRVRGLVTPYGELDFSMRLRNDSLTVRIADGLAVPPGGIAVVPPQIPWVAAAIDGEPVALASQGLVVRRLPATVVLLRHLSGRPAR